MVRWLSSQSPWTRDAARRADAAAHASAAYAATSHVLAEHRVYIGTEYRLPVSLRNTFVDTMSDSTLQVLKCGAP